MAEQRRLNPGVGQGALVSVRCHIDWLKSEEASRALLFTNQRSLKFIDTSAAFRTKCQKTRGRSLLALKLAFLFVLYAVVLSRDRKEKNIEMQYRHIVDDLQKFEEYPWGCVFYEYLVRATLSQHMAYELMPDLGRDCANAVKENLSRFPRILRWKVEEYYQHDYLLGYFAPQFADRLITLQEIDAQIKELGRKFDVLKGLIRRSAVDEEHGVGADGDEQPVGVDCDEEVDEDYVEALLREVFEKVNGIGEMVVSEVEKRKDVLMVGEKGVDEFPEPELGSSSKPHKGSVFGLRPASPRAVMRSSK
ncbi:hypothetical protein C2S53_018173 [Perilla frutescens var. hirtella]|uniref:DUF1985 domain-containing protein n=1 Tax=Perilla frutescens var. hirtella TaxID=608512 RepID=A0AAD4PEX4_PERFH|nr:hypothetical protein C2S53_018173 [Perilla frutescens var. hirtella]